MTRTATVVRVDGRSASVRNEAFLSEKAASSRRFWGVRERPYEAAVTAGLAPRPGDVVEIVTPPGPSVAWGAITFGLPLLFFPTGWILASRLFPASGEGIRFLIGIAALAAAYPVIALIARVTCGAGKGPGPVIRRIVSPAETHRLKCEAKTKDCGGCAACS